MLMPKKVRHRKVQRGRMRGAAKGGTRVTFGDYGIQALDPGWITNRQIEAAQQRPTLGRGGRTDSHGQLGQGEWVHGSSAVSLFGRRACVA